MVDKFITPVLIFFKENYVPILAIILTLIVADIIYIVTTKSLKSLKTEILSNYPFDLFFPKGGSWSLKYFFIILLSLVLVVFFLTKGKFI